MSKKVTFPYKKTGVLPGQWLRLILPVVFILGTLTSNIYAFQNTDPLSQNHLLDIDGADQFIDVKKFDEGDFSVSLNVEEMELATALQALTGQIRVGLSYDSDADLNHKISLKAENAAFYEVLDQMLYGTGLEYLVAPNRNTLVIRPQKEIESELQETVTGQVIDAETGESLPGVNIIVEGTNIGVVTDFDGEYTISVPDSESVLVFSYIGYIAQRVTVGDQAEINVELDQDLSQLDEVVVVGYGTVRRVDLTGAVTQVNTTDFERVPATNPLMSLQGRAPGLRITPNSGSPGASASIRVRGEQSISGSNSPIFVVDGNITSNIDNLSNQDIESVSVLKDASAVAIYGSRAANGVIVINTKRGSRDTTPTINFHAYTGIQHESNLRLNLLNADQFVEIYTEAHQNSGISIPWDESDLAAYQGVDSDWLGAVMEHGYLSNVDLSVAGGSENSNYYVAASHIDHQGMVINTDYHRTNLRLNTDHVVGDRIRFGNSLNLFSGKTNNATHQYVGALQKVPLTRIYEDDGSWGRIRNVPLEHMHANPLWQANDVSDRIQRGVLGNLYLAINLLEGLEFTARGNVEWTNDYRSQFGQGVPSDLGWEGSSINRVAKDNRETLFWQTDFLLEYENNFGMDHYVTGLLGYSVEEQTYERLWADGTGTPSNDIRYLSSVDPTSMRNTNTFSDWAFEAVFGRIGYTFRDRYIFNATVRRDGTSRLHSDHRWGTFPSFSAAWRISQEQFMDEVNWLDELKLRGSWGSTGNVLSISTYGTRTSLTNWNYAMGGQQRAGYTLASAVNSDLQWESTEKKNIGLDVEVFGNRLYGIVDFYIEDTRDLLFTQPIPNSTGLVGNPFINAGHIRNTGVELEMGYRQIVGEWRYSISLNMTHFKNEVIDLEGRDLTTSGIVEGYPLRSYYGYKSNGLIRTEDDLNNNPHFSGKQIGDIWFVDTNGDGSVSSDDRVILGDSYPDLTYGAMGTLGFRNWTIQAQLQGMQGVLRDIRGGHNLGVLHYFTQWAKNHDSLIMERYHPTKNPDGQYPIVRTDDSGSNLATFSDFWLSDASFLRISNVNLNYDFPVSLTEPLGIGSLSAYMSVQNLYTFTSFDGPEVDSNADALTGVPQPRTWLFGVRMSF